MNKISNNETNVNLRYDGYYLWLDYPRSPKWLQFYPNGIVGYGVHDVIEEIGGLEYYDYTPSID